MKTALLVKIARGQHVRSASQTGYTMEFADLLDGIEEQATPVAKPNPEPVCVRATVFADPIPVTVSVPDPVVGAAVLPVPAPAAVPDLGLADLVMFPVPHKFEPQPEPVVAPVEATVAEVVDGPVTQPLTVSRFAGNGLDDDLLPVRAPRRRLLR